MKKYSIKKLVKPTINQIAKYVPGRSSIEGKDKVIKLSSNESPFELPKKILDKILTTSNPLNLYPDGNSSFLKKAISKTFKIKENQIICGNGSDDILSVIAQTFCSEGDDVICSEYGFIYYPIIAKISGAKVKIAKTENLKVSCNNIIKKISRKTKIIFIANPNNPTGSVILRKELKAFLEQVPRNIIVVIDGAYSEFVLNKSYSDGIDLIQKFPNLVLTRTFSKIYALAGLRLGWAYSSNSIISLLEKVRGPFNVNVFAQKIGAEVLKEKKFLLKSVKHNLKWQKKLPSLINEMGLEAISTFANFIIVRVDKTKFSKKLILNELVKKNILIRDLTNYGLRDYIRISIGTDWQLNKLLSSLKEIMNKNYK